MTLRKPLRKIGKISCIYSHEQNPKIIIILTRKVYAHQQKMESLRPQDKKKIYTH